MELSLPMFSLELYMILCKSPQDINQFDLELEMIMSNIFFLCYSLTKPKK